MSPSPSSRSDRPVSPKDAFVTVYGRKPVLEALGDPALEVDKVVLAEGADRDAVRTFTEAARARGLVLQRASAQRVKVLAGNGRQDQGVLADVVAPRMRPIEHFLADLPDDADARVLVLDGLTNPANVGMILRSATGAGLEGVLLPRRGAPAIDPLVIKASAGVAFHAPVLRARSAADGLAALAEAGFVLVGLDGPGDSRGTTPPSLFEAELPGRVALVVGGETDGITDDVRGELHGTVTIPLAPGVESLNAAVAASVACFELARRRG
ncbi:TrmH family RNA methyltransferase [Actinomycetospora lemnae]|uniref:RNA methyltransferase n=1 Tax=Actinomycetospora lemnae TaxID=3019891 RepID=A0ABT5SLQ7_9PSEU|nr:RNA methyltransferase [Actinomycetospora sp. DW7H6]MDD7963763.1 RNA methyltransferase [Actinomycetospora sp. DW7H6]